MGLGAMNPIINSPAADFLAALHFELTIQKLPSVSFMVTAVQIPGLAISNSSLPTPFVQIPLPADKIQFEELAISFKVDGMMQNWLEIYSWLYGIGFPQTFQDRANIEVSGKINELYSDLSLVILDYHKQPILKASFVDVLPKSLSGFKTNTADTSVTYIESTVSFVYRQFTIEQLKTSY